jgi:hypothetical protein
VTNLGKFAEMESAAAAASAIAFDPLEKRLADFWNEHGLPPNILTDYLASKPDDTRAEGALKNAIESLGIGAVAGGGLFLGTKLLRALKSAERIRADAPDSIEPNTAFEGSTSGRASRAGNSDSVEPLAIAQGAARYRQFGNEKFVALSNGSVNLGEIPQNIARTIGREAAPIRLPQSVADEHLAGQRTRDINAAGYSDVAEFAYDIAKNYEEIWHGRGRALLLVKRIPSSKAGNAHTLIVQLEPAFDGSYYRVITTGNLRGKFPKGGNRRLLWLRASATSLTPAAGDESPFGGAAGNEAGSVSTSVGGQSNPP